MVTVRRAWQGQHRGSNAARRYLHNCTEARIARISGSMRSQMRALSLAPTLVVRAIVTCSHCQVASSPQEVQERLVPTRCDSKVRRDHSHSAVALLLRNSAIPGKSYGEEYPSWEKQPGSLSEERVAAIGPVMLPLQHSVISSKTGNMVF